MKALVLGAHGQLGLELVSLLGESSSAAEHDRISDAVAVDAMLASRKPEIVFNCAAYNAVDRAEAEPEAAYESNETGPAVVGAACRRHGARLVHFSTNFVFDGGLGEPYIESDDPHPLSVYGKSKLAGERAVLESHAEALVIRTAALFGTTTGRSFPERILQRARAGEQVRVVSDQTVNPTYVRDLAAAAVELAEKRFAGIVHAVNDGCSSWAEFAQSALFETGLKVAVEPISTGELHAPARRPANGCLGTIRYRALRPWREAVAEWAAELREA